MTSPYPLRFSAILKEKVWGGRRLAALGRLPDGKAGGGGSRGVGESWEIADLDETSASGGGGEAARSRIVNGPLAGRTLREVMEVWGEDLLGEREHARVASEGGAFPLLVKFLDAREHLSVQVHPSPAYARTHPGAHVKSEAWVVIGAEQGSTIFAGLRTGVTREDLRRALRRDDASGVVELLERVPARVGACHLLPSGTVHALGAGVLVLEVQTASDTTFRVYDWAKEYGRVGRKLHVDEALACAIEGGAPEVRDAGVGDGGIVDDGAGAAGGEHGDDVARGTRELCVSERFDLWSHMPRAGERVRVDRARGRAVGLVCLRGRAELCWPTSQVAGAGYAQERLEVGSVVLVPASIAGGIELVGGDGGAWVVGFGVGEV